MDGGSRIAVGPIEAELLKPQVRRTVGKFGAMGCDRAFSFPKLPKAVLQRPAVSGFNNNITLSARPGTYTET